MAILNHQHPSPLRQRAFELNNMACSFLRFGEFDAARETLEDALNIVYSCSSQAVVPMAIPASQLCLFAFQRLQRASLRLPQVSASRSSSWTPSEFLEVSMVSSEDASALKHAALNHGTSDEKLHFTCVLIHSHSVVEQDRLDLDKESGIILFNYALANYLLNCVTEGIEALPQCEAVFSALAFAQTTFGAIIDQVFECANDNQTDQMLPPSSFDIWQQKHLPTVYLSMLFLAISGHIHRDAGDFGAFMDTRFATQGIHELLSKQQILHHVQQQIDVDQQDGMRTRIGATGTRIVDHGVPIIDTCSSRPGPHSSQVTHSKSHHRSSQSVSSSSIPRLDTQIRDNNAEDAPMGGAA